jgi:hypothetical protein
MSASWNPRNWTNPLSWMSDKLDNSNDAYKTGKQDLRQIAQLVKLVSTVGGVVSALGIWKGGLGFSLIFTVPFAYFSYNGFRLGQNIETMAQNPNHYSVYLGWGTVVGKEKIDKDKVRECLVQNTFCFDFFVDWIIQSCVQ